jgi:hypothetical protein
MQTFAAAIAPPEGARREGDVYYAILGRAGMYNAADVRAELGDAFANIAIPAAGPDGAAPAMEFVEL